MISCGSTLMWMGALLQLLSQVKVQGFAPSSSTVSTAQTANPLAFLSPCPHELASNDPVRKIMYSNMRSRKFFAFNEDQSESEMEMEPQAVATGYSQHPDLLSAIQEATQSALSSLPSSLSRDVIDLGLVHISSIYDGQHSPTLVVPKIHDVIDAHYTEKGDPKGDHVLQKLIGCSAGGIIGQKSYGMVENEGGTGITITLCLLPDTDITTFHLLEDDVPDDYGRMDSQTWKQLTGLGNFNPSSEDESEDEDGSKDNNQSTFMLLPSPSFQTDLDDFLRGLSFTFGPSSTIFGGLASTVSSLSRAKLYRYDVDDVDGMQTLTDGCLGIAMHGDVKFDIMVAQGAKPVGGVYRIVSGQESTISAIQLDEIATEQLQLSEEGLEDDEDDDEDDDEQNNAQQEMNANAKAAAAYAKAVIPKPVLAEANYLMRTLSDDDQSFMRKSLLVGLERGGSIGKSPSDIIRLSQGMGHRFTVHQVASAGMKDGSVTLPLGSVNIEPGTRLRFFVKAGEYAKKEVQAIWTGYKKNQLEESMKGDAVSRSNNPAACFLFPTLDRGQKLFGSNKSAFESNTVSEFLPNIPSISGFFSNGVIAPLEGNQGDVMVHGSASCYATLGSRSNRPVYDALQAKREKEFKEKQEREEAEAEAAAVAENEQRIKDAQNLSGDDNSDEDENKPAPRSEDGELILKRREIHSGRALTVSAVEWSVAEKIAKPTSALEGFMWDKETEVDRFRERVPLSNLVSQCKLFDLDPTKPKPRGWIQPIRNALADSSENFIIIPELKRIEPTVGSLRKRYDISKLTKQYVNAGATALSINCDSVLFGGSLDDIGVIREATANGILESSNAEEGVIAPPILASDLILYPYQLYKLRLAGADAVNLIVGALTSKDLLYLTKIAKSLNMDVVASVTSEVQIDALTKLGSGIGAIAVSNRDLETFAFDDSGKQALDLLGSDAMKKFREVLPDALVLVEGRVGLVENGDDGNSESYVKALKDGGAMGAIVGGGLAAVKDDLSAYLKGLSLEATA